MRRLALIACSLTMSCSAHGMAIKQARTDFPSCREEPRVIEEWNGEVVLKVCGHIPVSYLVTLSGAKRVR